MRAPASLVEGDSDVVVLVWSGGMVVTRSGSSRLTVTATTPCRPTRGRARKSLAAAAGDQLDRKADASYKRDRSGNGAPR